MNREAATLDQLRRVRRDLDTVRDQAFQARLDMAATPRSAPPQRVLIPH